MSVNERIFVKLTRARPTFVKASYSKFHENTIKIWFLVLGPTHTYTHTQTDGWTDVVPTKIIFTP